jgi:hypothetical protein
MRAFVTKGLLSAAACALIAAPAQSETIQVFDADIAPGSNVVWTAGNEYVLNGFVFVDAGASLTIEPGTVVKGKPGVAENASALIVAKGGRIFANGTAAAPIVFTAEADDVSDAFDLPLDTRGLWGGVIMLGNASLNSSPGVSAIEGIPTTEPRGEYGGTDDNDNSGVFRYVSIRYGGSDIGAGNEINGLTMGGVGRNTVIEYVEVFNNQDDGFEWFGGTVNTKYLVSAFNGDDSFDIDEGWRGKNQFWFVIQAEDIGDRAGEHDGGTDPEDGMPYAAPVIYNATFIGSGVGASNPDNPEVFLMRDNFGGSYYNSLFTDFVGDGVNIEDLASGEDSRARLDEGTLNLANNLWWGFGAGNDIAGVAKCSGACDDESWVADHLLANNNRIEDPLLRGISRIANNGLDPRPLLNSPALSGSRTPEDPFFTPTAYVGAFGPSDRDLWIAGWTFLSQAGILVQGDFATVVAEESSVSSAVPSAYELGSSPNPWNPSTTITYSLPADGVVDLSIYNAAGQKVANLVQGFRPAGTYNVQLSGDELASGVYYYRLVSPAGVLTRATTLLK